MPSSTIISPLTKYSLGTAPDPYRVIKAVYSHLAETVTFDATKRIDGERRVERSSVYDALIVRRASSKGIALAAETLLLAMGIPCESISGDGYCFNMVCLNERWLRDADVHLVSAEEEIKEGYAAFSDGDF